MESFNTVQELFSPIFTVLINCRIQFLFTFNVFPATVTIQGFALNFSSGTGVNTRGAGEGMPFMQGKMEVEFSRIGGLLRTPFSGDSTSLFSISIVFPFPLWKVLGRRRALGESGNGRFLAEKACRRCTKARAAWRREPFIRGGRKKGAA